MMRIAQGRAWPYLAIVLYLQHARALQEQDLNHVPSSHISPQLCLSTHLHAPTRNTLVRLRIRGGIQDQLTSTLKSSGQSYSKFRSEGITGDKDNEDDKEPEIWDSIYTILRKAGVFNLPCITKVIVVINIVFYGAATSGLLGDDPVRHFGTQVIKS